MQSQHQPRKKVLSSTLSTTMKLLTTQVSEEVDLVGSDAGKAALEYYTQLAQVHDFHDENKVAIITGAAKDSVISNRYFEMQHYKMAVHYLEKIIANFIFDAQAYYRLSVCHLALKEVDTVMDYITMAIAVHPCEMFYVLRASLHFKLSNFEAGNEDKESARLYADTKRKDSLDLLPCVFQINLHRDKGDFLTAANLATTLIKNSKSNDNVFFLRGLCYRDLKKYKKAIRDFEKSIALNPADIRYRFQLSLVYFLDNKFSEAKREMLFAIVNDAGNNLSHKKSSILALFLKMNDEAKKAPVNKTENQSVRTMLALGKKRLLQPNGLEEAVSSFSGVIERENDNIIAYAERGLANLKLKRYDAAFADFAIAVWLDNIAASPVYPSYVLLERRRLLFIKANNLPAALHEHEFILLAIKSEKEKAKQNNALYKDLMEQGREWLHANEFEDAIIYFNNAKKFAADESEVEMELTKAYALLGMVPKSFKAKLSTEKKAENPVFPPHPKKNRKPKTPKYKDMKAEDSSLIPSLTTELPKVGNQKKKRKRKKIIRMQIKQQTTVEMLPTEQKKIPDDEKQHSKVETTAFECTDRVKLEDYENDYLARLRKRGTASFIFGGRALNLFLKRPDSIQIDLDILTNASHEVIMEEFKEYKIVLVTPTNDLYRFISPQGKLIEILRNPTVLEKTLPEFASQLDFTINTLIVLSDGQVLDPLGVGKKDALDNRQKSIMKAIDSYTLQPIRALRGIIQANQRNTKLDKDDIAAMAKIQKWVTDEKSSGQLNTWMRKLFESEMAVKNFSDLLNFGLVHSLFPTIAASLVQDAEWILNEIRNVNKDEPHLLHRVYAILLTSAVRYNPTVDLAQIVAENPPFAIKFQKVHFLPRLMADYFTRWDAVSHPGIKKEMEAKLDETANAVTPTQFPPVYYMPVQDFAGYWYYYPQLIQSPPVYQHTMNVLSGHGPLFNQLPAGESPGDSKRELVNGF